MEEADARGRDKSRTPLREGQGKANEEKEEHEESQAEKEVARLQAAMAPPKPFASIDLTGEKPGAARTASQEPTATAGIPTVFGGASAANPVL